MARSVRFRCRGHANLRATHHKTLELTREGDISSRASCVVGVSADYELREVARLRGPVRLELEVGGRRESLAAVATPFMATAESLVFRRSGQRRGKTFAFAADRSARDLDRRFVAALADPATVMEVTLTETPGEGAGRPPGAGVANAGALLILLEDARQELSPRACRFIAAADLVVASEMRRWRSGTVIDDSGPAPELLACRRPEDLPELVARLEEGQRMVLAAKSEALTEAAPALELIRHAAARGVPMTCIGSAPPWLMALVLSGCPGVPFALQPSSLPAAAWQRELASPALRQGTLILEAGAGQIRARLGALADSARDQVFLARDPGGPGEELWRGCPAELAESCKPRKSDRSPWFLVAGPEAGSAGRGETADEPNPVPGLLAELLAAGVPLKTLARAARGEFGGSYRQAYRHLLGLRRGIDGAAEPHAPTRSKVPG